MNILNATELRTVKLSPWQILGYVCFITVINNLLTKKDKGILGDSLCSEQKTERKEQAGHANVSGQIFS